MKEQNTDYTKKVLDHFQNPRNMGELAGADAESIVGNPSCGDVLKVMLKIGKNDKGEDVIEDIKFQTMGCAAAISTSSMLTVLSKGKTIGEAKEIGPKDIERALGRLPPIKVHCSNLGAKALKKAIEVWEKKNKK